MKAPLSLLALVAALAALGLTSSATGLPPAPPEPSCSPGPANCSAWHASNVTVSWPPPPSGVTASGCGPVTVSTDGGTPVTCTWTDGSGSRSTTIIVRRDTAAPGVTASPDRGPDNNGWYNHPVSLSFSGDDGGSGVASCTSATYGGPDTGSVSVSGSCADNAGNVGRTSIEIRYDATPPSVEAKPDRAPNAGGWYNRQVTVAFVGADPVSGVDSCTPPVTYSGPDAPKTSVSGTCQDKAANTSSPAGFELAYDTKPPAIGRVRAAVGTKGIALRWTASKDAVSFEVVRRPGTRGSKPATLYKGEARSFTDRRLRNGVKYRYTVTAYDQAGNGAAKGLAARAVSTVSKPTATKPTKPTGKRPTATPDAPRRAALTRPAAGARVNAPPVLAWTPVSRATYYNVQLYRNGRKILTAWPNEASFRLGRSWRFGGRTQRLAPGTYRWYVWPGFGSRAGQRYGKLIGTRTFVVAPG